MAKNFIFLCYKNLKSPIDALLLKSIIINVTYQVFSGLKLTAMITLVRTHQKSKGVYLLFQDTHSINQIAYLYFHPCTYVILQCLIIFDTMKNDRIKKKEETYVVCVNFCNDLLNRFLISHIILLKCRL